MLYSFTHMAMVGFKGLSDRRNLFYEKSASFRCDGRLFHSPGPAAADVLSPKVLHVCVNVQISQSSPTDNVFISPVIHMNR